jgi:hypothetical protein
VVDELNGDSAVVTSRPLRWDGEKLDLDDPRVETVIAAHNGYSLAGPLHRGNTVSLHWDWISERITTEQARRIQRATASQLAIVNGPAAPGPAVVLG